MVAVVVVEEEDCQIQDYCNRNSVAVAVAVVEEHYSFVKKDLCL